MPSRNPFPSTERILTRWFKLLAGATIVLCACDELQPEVPDSTANISTELLRSSEWSVSSIQIDVEDAPLPPAALVGAADDSGELVSGTIDITELYESLEIAWEPLPVRFDDDRVVLEDIRRVGYYEDLGSRYNLLDGEFMSFSLRDTPPVMYTYQYDEETGEFEMTADGVEAQIAVQAWNTLLNRLITSGTLDRAAAAAVDRLYNNDRIRAAIERELTDIITGRVEGRPDLIDAPEAAAYALAKALILSGVVPPRTDIDQLAQALLAVIESLQQAIDAGTDDLVAFLVDNLMALGSEWINTALPPEQLEAMINAELYSRIEQKQDLISAVRSIRITLKKGATDD